MTDQPLHLPVLLGTVRRGRHSAAVARLVHDLLARREGVVTELIDIRQLDIATDDAGEAVKQAEFADTISVADGFVIVAPEYNHGYPGMLKHVLDSNYGEYVHKPVGLVGVSSGAIGGARMIENLLPVLRTFGLVTIPWDVNIANVGGLFDEQGELVDDRYLRRVGSMLGELIWMATTLRHGRRFIVNEARQA